MLEGGEPSYFDKYEPGRLEGDNLGNTERGDGIRFKGRGLIQVTGRYNYKSYGKYRGTVFDTDATSSLLVTDSYNTCDASGWYWASKQRQRFVKNPITRKDDMVPFGKLSISYWADQGRAMPRHFRLRSVSIRLVWLLIGESKDLITPGTNSMMRLCRMLTTNP